MASKDMHILLGYMEEPVTSKNHHLVDYTTNKIGGLPNWCVEGSNIPMCCRCIRKMLLVMQIYAPLENNAYHRILYMFACITPDCWNKHHSWICLRSQVLCTSSGSSSSAIPTLTTTSTSSSTIVTPQTWLQDEDDWNNDGNGNINEDNIAYSTSSTYLQHSRRLQSNVDELDINLNDRNDNASPDLADLAKGLHMNLNLNKVDNLEVCGATAMSSSSQCAEQMESCSEASALIEGAEGDIVAVDSPDSVVEDLHALMQEVVHIDKSTEVVFESHFVSCDVEPTADTNLTAHESELLMQYTQSTGHAIAMQCDINRTGKSAELCSGVIEEKIFALHTLASLTQEKGAVYVLLQDKLVSAIIPLIKSENQEILLGATGALRNLCADASDEVMEILLRHKLMSAVGELMHKFRDSTPPGNPIQSVSEVDSTRVANSITSHEDPFHVIYIHATHLLLNLCECSEEAVLSFNREDLLSIVLQHIEPNVWGIAVALASAQCLLCVTENNPNAISILLPRAQLLVNTMQTYHTQGEASALHYSVVIAGILLNINYGLMEGPNLHLVLNVLSVGLEIELPSHLAQMQDDSASASIQELEHYIIAQQIALEFISYICYKDDEDEDSDYEYKYMDDEQMETYSCHETQQNGKKDQLPLQVMEELNNFGIVDKCLKVSSASVAVSLERNTTLTKHLQQMLHNLSVSSLLCLQHLVASLDVESLGGDQLLYDTWLALGNRAFNNATEDDFLESSTGLMREIMEKLNRVRSETISNISMQDLKVILSACASCSVPGVRANLSRTLGTVACVIVDRNTTVQLCQGEPIEVLSVIVEQLFKVSSSDYVLWVCAEALDVLIDIFSEDNTDALAGMLQLVPRLRGIQPGFTAKFKQEKKRLGNHLPLVQTVRDNLASFIKYKATRVNKK